MIQDLFRLVFNSELFFFFFFTFLYPESHLVSYKDFNFTKYNYKIFIFFKLKSMRIKTIGINSPSSSPIITFSLIKKGLAKRDTYNPESLSIRYLLLFG